MGQRMNSLIMVVKSATHGLQRQFKTDATLRQRLRESAITHLGDWSRSGSQLTNARMRRHSRLHRRRRRRRCNRQSLEQPQDTLISFAQRTRAAKDIRLAAPTQCTLADRGVRRRSEYLPVPLGVERLYDVLKDGPFDEDIGGTVRSLEGVSTVGVPVVVGRVQ